jgi:hypothetical protein
MLHCRPVRRPSGWGCRPRGPTPYGIVRGDRCQRAEQASPARAPDAAAANGLTPCAAARTPGRWLEIGTCGRAPIRPPSPTDCLRASARRVACALARMLPILLPVLGVVCGLVASEGPVLPVDAVRATPTLARAVHSHTQSSPETVHTGRKDPHRRALVSLGHAAHRCLSSCRAVFGPQACHALARTAHLKDRD